MSAIVKEKVFGGNDQFINPLNYPAAPYWVMLAYKQLAGTEILAGELLRRALLTKSGVTHVFIPCSFE